MMKEGQIVGCGLEEGQVSSRGTITVDVGEAIGVQGAELMAEMRGLALQTGKSLRVLGTEALALYLAHAREELNDGLPFASLEPGAAGLRIGQEVLPRCTHITKAGASCLRPTGHPGTHRTRPLRR